MLKGVLPWSRAYWFARETTQAGASEIPCASGMALSGLEASDERKRGMTYQIEHFAGHDEAMEAVHDLLDASLIVPLRQWCEHGERVVVDNSLTQCT